MMYICSLVVASVLAGTLFMVHVGLHRENACHMTYMWRYISLVPFNVDGNDVSRYGLYRYMEGFVNDKTMAISHDHIPVLFVPGSGGSAKQVRSVASIMMNKTEMTSAPFRMHFYAVDFDEELSFLSGSILNRQRDFVVRAISTIQKMYSRKIILIGHSLGGTVLHALPAHPRFSISNMGLVIILASPISAPPIVMDEAMISFYESMQRAWVSRNDELRHVGLVSYSGGSKDFQVPDHLATIHGSHHIVHRPSWSIRGVDTPVDHLCILWCNQLTRHSTRILYNYGIEEVSKDVPRPANALVEEFFHEESHASANGSESLKDAVKIGIFDYPWVSRVYRGTMENSKKFYELEFISPYMVYSVSLESPCDMSMLFIYPNTLARSATAKESAKVMTIDLPYELSSSVGHIALEGKTGCDFDLTVRPDVFYAWYLLLISNVNVVIHFTFSVLVALTLLEKLKSFDRIRFRSQLGYYVNCGIAVLLFLSFTYSSGIRECIFAVTIFYSISSVYFVAVVVRYVRDKVLCVIPLCLKLCNVVLTLVVILLLPVNPYLANGVIALVIALHRSSGPFSILLSIATGGICASLGLAGPSRDATFHFLKHLMGISSLEFIPVLNLLSSNFDFTHIFTKLVFLFMLSRAITFVRLPPHLVSLKDFMLAVLLVVPGFMASHVNMSLEACAMIASVLLYIISAF
ncbi:hypothetical protein Y032_0560g3470 [Ancylostoma ceylanicum]|uniref:GPI inositol-deacylase n=2 Tax=Ancylostoma ceylanicum TaxID=53326 RepID=A0A016WPD3_9BILA|nr:hypothetical protein Y032_0560g3470 [Ancylostoma ceylanicum]